MFGLFYFSLISNHFRNLQISLSLSNHTGFNVVDTFQLAAFHGLKFSKEEVIYGSGDETIDHEERNACAIQRFAGILAKQLLMMGQRLKREEQRKRKREGWKRRESKEGGRDVWIE